MKFKARLLSLAVLQIVLTAPPVSAGRADEIIVRFRGPQPGAAVTQAETLGRMQALESLGASIVSQPPKHPQFALVKKQPGLSTDAMLKRLRANPEILYAEPDAEVHVPDPEPDEILSAEEASMPGFEIAGLPNDPLLSWGYADIQAHLLAAPAAPGPLVAVIDTGVDYTHPELAGKVILGRDYHNNDGDPMDDHGHGTHVSGIVAAEANNGQGSAGVSPNSTILAMKVLGGDGSGSTFNVMQAVLDAADDPDVRIMNLSLGAIMTTQSFLDAVTYAVGQKGKLMVAAAGNSNSVNGFFPAMWSHAYRGLMGVAAHETNGCKASFSNWGINATISAPGRSILSTLPGNNYASWSGTSMATPFVAGAAARLLTKNPAMTNFKVQDLLEDYGRAISFAGGCWPILSQYPYGYDPYKAKYYEVYRFSLLDLASSLNAAPLPPADTSPPQVSIESPTTADLYRSDQAVLDVSGSAADDIGIAQVTWSNVATGESGTAASTNAATGPEVLWRIEAVALIDGVNTITVTARDLAGNTDDAILTVIRSAEGSVPGESTRLRLRVTHTESDSMETLNTGKNQPDVVKALVGKGQVAAYHFDDVMIPLGAQIVSARIYQSCASQCGAPVALHYSGEAAGDAAAFTKQTGELSRRPKTIATVREQPVKWNIELNPGPDVSGIIEEIVSRADWQEGNALNLFVADDGTSSNRRYVYHYGVRQADQVPALEIEYIAP